MPKKFDVGDILLYDGQYKYRVITREQAQDLYDASNEELDVKAKKREKEYGKFLFFAVNVKEDDGLAMFHEEHISLTKLDLDYAFTKDLRALLNEKL